MENYVQLHITYTLPIRCMPHRANHRTRVWPRTLPHVMYRVGNNITPTQALLWVVGWRCQIAWGRARARARVLWFALAILVYHRSPVLPATYCTLCRRHVVTLLHATIALCRRKGMQDAYMYINIWYVYVHMCVCVHVHIYIYIYYIYIHLFIYLYVHIVLVCA